MTKKYQRTDKDFIIESISSLKDVIQRHTEAGFVDISDEIIFRRFFQLIKFLQEHNLTNKLINTSLSTLSDKSELKNSDLTDKGFYFLQYALPKWEDRFHKDQGEEKEWKFLEKWHINFKKDYSDLN